MAAFSRLARELRDGYLQACLPPGPAAGAVVWPSAPRQDIGTAASTTRRPQAAPHQLSRLQSPRYDDSVSSTKPAMEIDLTSQTPLHEQVAAAIRRAIADGEAQSGERLPPAKDLAAVLGVNPNTVFRALRTLRDEG